jgi:CTP:phosphocholine cytidylyltransferase-like protein
MKTTQVVEEDNKRTMLLLDNDQVISTVDITGKSQYYIEDIDERWVSQDPEVISTIIRDRLAEAKHRY